jgi:chemotaxis response regulator CheB
LRRRRGEPLAKTVLIVDDNEFVRRGLRELFKRETDMEVCGEAENGRLAIEEAGRLHPDLIVLDLLIPVKNGLDAARALRRLMPSVPLIMYNAFEDRFPEQVTVQVPTWLAWLVLDKSGRISHATVDDCENWATNCKHRWPC